MKRESTKKIARGAAREISLIALGVALITVCAWISIPVGEVPFTLQTLAVAAVGGLLGVRRGTLAVLVYILMGLVGVPVFTGFRPGIVALMGATGGYIVGFLFAAPISGAAKSLPVKRNAARVAVLWAMNLLGLAVCYFFGTAWFLVVLGGGNAGAMGLGAALMLCVVPYIVPDCIKLFLAALLTVRLEKYVK